MTNIVFIVSDISTSGGLNSVTIDLANKLSMMGNNIRFISYGTKQSSNHFEINENISIDYLNFKDINMKKDFYKIAKYIRHNISIEKNSYVVVSEVGNIISAYIGLRRKDLKIIGWDHTSFYNGKKFGIAWIGRYISAKKLYKTITLTKDSENCYRKYFKTDNVVQIYNVLENDNYTVNYDSKSTKIISCGGLDNSIKGFDMLVEVASKVFKEHKNWSWDIYGEGVDKEKIKKKIKEYNLEDKVFLRGYSKNIKELYQQYSFFVFTSRHEGLGLVVAEAQQNKLPVVSFDCSSGPSELIIDGQNGFLIECYDIEEMANKIIKLICDENLRISFSRKAKVLHKELEPDIVMKKWYEILKY